MKCVDCKKKKAIFGFDYCADCGQKRIKFKAPSLKEAIEREREGWRLMVHNKPVRDMDERIVAVDCLIANG